ncbi:MAG: GTPase HflX [Bacteriovoracaceae bacterium]
MLDNELHISKNSKALAISLVSPQLQSHKDENETRRSINELKELLKTLEVPCTHEVIQNRRNVDPATILGSGKIEEIATLAKENDIDLLVFDIELTASQIRNIKKISNISVIDRCHVILEIFSKHAHTKEARIQIEIARLQYLLPRLSGFWSHFSRQKGGIGVRGGEGEQQIELDRRIVRQRIEHYKRELLDVQKSREQQRKKRQNKAVTAALVGYTNAGKSSLLNSLCKVQVKSEDKLFATLDATFRMLNPDTKPPMILIDTVGFISNLPNTLIDGFKTTLESALEADLLVIVCDISDPHLEKHIDVTLSVLEDLNLQEKDKFFVFNKRDILKDPLKAQILRRKYPDSFLISSLDKNDVSKLRSHIINYFLEKQDHYDLFIPYDEGLAHSQVVSLANVVSHSNHEKGIYYRVRTPDFIFNQSELKKYILGPEQLENLGSPLKDH